MKFTDDQKTVNEFNDNYFKFGVHKVQIASFNLDKTDNNQEFIEATVVDPENGEITDTARLWFTSDKATNYAFNILRAIFVHNALEDKKDAAKEKFDSLTSTDELVTLLASLAGRECWFTKYYDAERTYTAQDGKVKKSVNKNIYGYEPNLKPELMPVSAEDVKNVIGGEEVPFHSEGDAPGSTVPADDAWSK